MDCSLPGFSAHGILQARALEWVAISLSRISSQIVGRRFTIWATGEVPDVTLICGYLDGENLAFFLENPVSWRCSNRGKPRLCRADTMARAGHSAVRFNERADVLEQAEGRFNWQQTLIEQGREPGSHWFEMELVEVKKELLEVEGCYRSKCKGLACV